MVFSDAADRFCTSLTGFDWPSVRLITAGRSRPPWRGMMLASARRGPRRSLKADGAQRA